MGYEGRMQHGGEKGCSTMADLSMRGECSMVGAQNSVRQDAARLNGGV